MAPSLLCSARAALRSDVAPDARPGSAYGPGRRSSDRGRNRRGGPTPPRRSALCRGFGQATPPGHAPPEGGIIAGHDDTARMVGEDAHAMPRCAAEGHFAASDVIIGLIKFGAAEESAEIAVGTRYASR